MISNYMKLFIIMNITSFMDITIHDCDTSQQSTPLNQMLHLILIFCLEVLITIFCLEVLIIILFGFDI